MKVTARLLLGITIALATLSTAIAQGQARTSADQLIDAHEKLLGSLQAERNRLNSGKSTLFNVLTLASDLRSTELKIARHPIERIAALNRFRSLLADIEIHAKTALDRRMIDAERAGAEKELAHTKRDAAQIEQINQRQRRLALERRRDLWRKDLDGSPLVHPILPPKLAENRR